MSNPPERAITWATGALGPDVRITGTIGLHRGSSPWVIDYCDGADSGRAVLRVADWGRIWGPAITRAAAGLTVAAEHDLPTARLIAVDRDGSGAGEPALLETFCGESAAPVRAAMPSAGAALAVLHRIRMEPADSLPLVTHHTPADDHPTARRWAAWYRDAAPAGTARVVDEFLRHRPWFTRAATLELLENTPTSPLLEAADERIRRTPMPTGAPVFLHGDLWLGNMLWDDGNCRGLIDWKSAGVGHPGVDLGSLRMRAAFAFGARAADEVTDAWEQAMRRSADSVAYWDVVAALHTPYDEQTELRDAFLDEALGRLERDHSRAAG